VKTRPVTLRSGGQREGDKKETEKEIHTLYAHFDGYKGDVRVKGYEGWIEFNSIQFGAGMGISSPGGRRWGGDDDEEEVPEYGEDDYPERECSDPSISEVSVTKKQNSVSSLMFYNMCSKKNHETVILDIVETQDDGRILPIFRYILKHVIFSGFSTSWGRKSTPPNESLSLNFSAIEVVTFVDGVPHSAAGYHMPSDTATYKTGSSLEVAEKFKNKKKEDEKKKKKKKAFDASADDEEGGAKITEVKEGEEAKEEKKERRCF